jgi:peptidoglycan/xylan/chitin deacetylase (PgdA/CDA1 family)
MLYRFFIKTPEFIKRFFSSYIWSIDTTEKKVYLTFDDGPHPAITPFVLDQLSRYNALATFFCIGSNVAAYPKTYQQIIAEGHAVGNHTYDHLNGWLVSDHKYAENIATAAALIHTNLFRPPYGKIKNSQARQISKSMNTSAKVIMWDVLSADFVKSVNKENCLNNVVKNYRSGSIVVFHDSEKAFPKLEYALPVTLKMLSEEGFVFDKIVIK